MILKYLLSLSIIFPLTDTYKILVVNPKFGYSHVHFFSQVADILVDAGHNVTVLTIEMDPSITHPGSYKANIIKYPTTKEIADQFVNSIGPEIFWNLKNSISSQLKMISKVMDAFFDMATIIFNDDKLTEVIRKEKYDVGIAEVLIPFFFGMFKVWKVKASISAVSYSTNDKSYQDFGLDFPTSYMPSVFSSFSDKMTYVERCQNMYIHLMANYQFDVCEYKSSLQDEFDKKYGKEFFEKNKALGDTSFVILNSNPFIDIPGQRTAKMVEVSGIGISEAKPLNDYWDKILSLRSKNILISFGTLAKGSFMPKNLKYGLLETIRRLKDITFIWKYETPKDGTGEGIENLILSKWLPQSDLLNDKRLTLFITHGGLGSTTETFFRGVPVIGIPILADQLKNVKLFERHGIGIIMDKEDLINSEILDQNIKEVIDNEKYKRNAEVMAKMLKKRPMQPKELLIKHVEFAAEFGDLKMLDLASRNMGFIEYYNLDIIIPFFILLISLFLFILYLLYKSFIRCFKVKIKTD
uniref:UDP-glucuronosyltransferase n=1 Tax=Parastrongyloides trichosuri TaxID=131310 RepID=A0A0N5A0P5_PARTI